MILYGTGPALSIGDWAIQVGLGYDRQTRKLNKTLKMAFAGAALPRLRAYFAVETCYPPSPPPSTAIPCVGARIA